MALGCFLFVGILWNAACNKKKIIADTVSIFYGEITDSVSGAPIDSALVTAGDTTGGQWEPWYSDSTGFYRLASWGTDATIFVRKSGYVTQSRWVEARGSDSTNADFRLVPA